MNDKPEVCGLFKYQQDSKRFHRFEVQTQEGIAGSIYIPKDLRPMPKTITLSYAGKDE
jgi:hypothetical protein